MSLFEPLWQPAATTAATIPFTPSGGLTEPTVEGALIELDTKKLAIADIDDAPVDGVVNAPISSNWAFDHAADATAHSIGVSTVNSQSDSYELVLTDVGKTVLMDKGSAQTLTIPANGAKAFAVGTVINVIQTGAGQVTFAITSDTLLSSLSKVKLAGQYSAATLYKTASTTWVLIGDLVS